MVKKDFYGNSFVWWIGIVEERTSDPLKMGRVRVRIFGIHPFLEDGSPDKSSAPTDTLPWAQVYHSTTGTKSFSGPREGDWVFGHFLDGNSGQMPVIIGISPGIDNEKTLKTQENSENSPKPPENVVGRVSGEPTTPRIGRGVIEKTIINKTNNDRVHVCDVTNEINQAIGMVKTAFSTIVENLNKFIRNMLNILGNEPSGITRTIIKFAQEVKSKIDKITEYVKDFQEIAKQIVKVAQKLREMVDYILSLPEKTLQFIRECSVSFLSSISNQVNNLVNIPGVSLSPSGEVGQVLSQVGKFLESGVSYTVNTGTLPASAVDAFLSPSGSMSSDDSGYVYQTWLEQTQGNIDDVKTQTSSFNKNNP